MTKRVDAGFLVITLVISNIEKHETPREVQITIVDTDGNVKEKVKETTKAISTLDEKDLGLLEDMDKIIWGDVDKENDLVESV